MFDVDYVSTGELFLSPVLMTNSSRSLAKERQNQSGVKAPHSKEKKQKESGVKAPQSKARQNPKSPNHFRRFRSRSPNQPAPFTAELGSQIWEYVAAERPFLRRHKWRSRWRFGNTSQRRSIRPGFAISSTGAGGVVDETYISEEIVTGWRGLCEEGIVIC